MQAYDAEKIILRNKDSIIEICQEYIIQKYPKRTKKLFKCKRDLGYVINAMISYVYDEHPAEIERLIDSFYSGGTLQLKSTFVEKEVYELLKNSINDLIIDELINKKIENFFDYLINNIDNRSYEDRNIDYKTRRNYALFHKDIKVPFGLENRLDTVIKEMPLQRPHDNQFILVKLKDSDEDIKIKEFYVENCFFNDAGQYMPAVCTAPLVYLIFRKDNYNGNNIDLNIGVHGGALIAETLKYGFHFSYIGCTNETELLREISLKKIEEKISIDMTDYHYQPTIAFCIGKGIKYSQLGSNEQWYELSSGKLIKYRGLDDINESRKPNILF